MQRGGGRIDLAAAIQASATIEASPNQASIDFGTIPANNFAQGIDVTVTSVSSSSYTYTISINEAKACGCVSVSTTSLTVTSGSVGTFTTGISIDSSVASGQYYGDFVLSGGPVNLVIPYWFSSGSPTGGGLSRTK